MYLSTTTVSRKVRHIINAPLNIRVLVLECELGVVVVKLKIDPAIKRHVPSRSGNDATSSGVIRVRRKLIPVMRATLKTDRLDLVFPTWMRLPTARDVVTSGSTCGIGDSRSRAGTGRG